MVPQHQEPKGLPADTTSLPDVSRYARRVAAVNGSRRLRNAILVAKGYKIPVEPKNPPAAFKRPSSPQLCPTCLAPVRKRTMIADIQQTVAAYYGLDLQRLLSDDRRRNVVRVRQVAMYLACQITTSSIAEVGRRFGRDHTTVLHAIKEVNRRAQFDHEEAFDVALLRERLSA